MDPFHVQSIYKFSPYLIKYSVLYGCVFMDCDIVEFFEGEDAFCSITMLFSQYTAHSQIIEIIVIVIIIIIAIIIP